nr:hypothetical protein [Candidatus Sigynarchaeota archaeon]
ECKWQDKVNAMAIAKELDKKASFIPWHEETRGESFAIFARTFSKTITEISGKAVSCFDLNRMETSLFNPGTMNRVPREPRDENA